MLRKVCKFFLIGFCPYEFFKNSKVDLGYPAAARL